MESEAGAGAREFTTESPFGHLTPAEVSVWFAYMKVHLRLRYEMNHQLRRDADISLPDYDVLVALTSTEDQRMRLGDLATRIGSERSRVSHHTRRMRDRGLVELTTAPGDRRGTEIALTDAGRTLLRQATPDHVDLVRRAFLDALSDAEKDALATGLNRVYDRLIEHGTLPRPEDHP